VTLAGDDDAQALPAVADKVVGLDERDGLFRSWIDHDRGRLWLALPSPGDDGLVEEILYSDGLRSGLGSNPVGLDRGRLGATRWLAIRRLGRRVLFEQLNPTYRATSDVDAERRAARESFATSVLWSTPIAALDADGTALIDLTPFLIRDSHGIGTTLKNAGEGIYTLDDTRSLLLTRQTLHFPDNLEFDALLTFAGEPQGSQVPATAPSADSVTLTLHHSLIRLPDDGYRPREFTPGCGMWTIDFTDYGVALDVPVNRQWIGRHRQDKPIVYYVDRGAPEPVRSALLDGVGWWADAFADAGLPDAFRAELLPEDAHPLDVRFNVVEWVHRQTRGWSYGGGVVDPRTGEILKGHVRLGSLRVRQDRLLFEGLAGVGKTGSGDADDPVQLALARIRQLAAHEVGHALGLSHNFAASTYGDRASVMDYPAPRVSIADGKLNFSDAYGVGVGSWDRFAIRYAYSMFPNASDETRELKRLLELSQAEGWLYLSDADARPAAASDPRANLWDNGEDPLETLRESMAIRRFALDRFGEGNVAVGRPLAELQEVLAPLYFHHRYQLQAAAKLVGGMEYHYALRGDGQTATRIVDASRQREALDYLITMLDVEALQIPETTLKLLAPRAAESRRNREMFNSRSAPAFDALGAAATASQLIVSELLVEARLQRMIDFHRRDAAFPDADDVLRALASRAVSPDKHREDDATEEVVRSVIVQGLIRLGQSERATPALRSRAESTLARVAADLPTERSGAYWKRRIDRFLTREFDGAHPERVADEAPPGSPIGTPPPDMWGCSRGG